MKAEKEEHEKRMLEIHRKVSADEPVTDAEWEAWLQWGRNGSSSSAGKRRKRKKRSKRKLPSRSSLSGASVCSLPSSSLTTTAYTWLVCWLRCFSRSVPFGRRQARDARHHGRYERELLFCAPRFRQWHVQGSFCWFYALRCAPFCCWQAQMLGIMASMMQKQLIIKVVVTQMLFHMVQAVLRTIEIPQLLVDKVVDALVMLVVKVIKHSCRDADADPNGPGCSADHRDFAVAVRCQVVDVPVERVVQVLRWWL